MRVIVETQSRARARVRVQTWRVLMRFFEALAGVPLAPRENGVTFRHISPVRQAMRSVVPVQLRGNRQALAMTMGLLFGSIHALFALLNIVAGLLTRSWWIFSVGVVVAALNAGKSYLASGALMSVVAERAGEEADSLRRCRRSGFALVALVLGMSKTLERIVLQGFGDGYPGALLYVYAAYALVLIATALVNLVRARREETLAVKGVRAFNLASALISIFALQAVLLSRVDWGSLPAWVSRDALEAAVVGSVSLCMVGIGLWLAVSATVRLTNRRDGGVRVRRRRSAGRTKRRRGAARRSGSRLRRTPST